MTEINVAQSLIIGHLWQSVAIAAVLAAVLILGRRMRGATRYSLAGVAFIASLALPLAAFVPGETLVTTVLEKLDAPKTAPAEPASAPAQPSFLNTVAKESGVPSWVLEAGARALASSEGVPASEGPIGRTAVEDGAPAWAIDLGGEILRAAVGPAPAPEPPKAEPLFALPEFKLPDVNLPDLTLPLALVWLAGTLILLVRVGRDLMAVERLVANARPAELPEKLQRRMKGVRVAVSPDAPGPMAAGLFRPCIVLPESIALNSPGMAALLEHEKAHIQRRDMAIALAQRVVLALLWWSPALYWISRRIDEEREVACDEAAVHCTGDAKAFARSLTLEAQNQLWARAPRLAVGAIGPRSQVGRRIRRLIDLAKGISPAKYSGRLAFAGLALAVAVAAMVTPRFPADAQQSTVTPFDDALAGEPSAPQSRNQTFDRERAQAEATLDGAARNGRVSYTSDGEDFAALGDEINALMQTVGSELEVALSGLSPELEAELHGLSAEMAALGAEISVAVSQEVLNEMPQIMEDVRRSLEAEGIEVGDWQDFRGLSEEQRQELREKLQEARDEIREQLGPEMREEIREAIEEARAELAEHREEIRAAIQESHDGMAIARAAMAEARAEIEAARARGDFDKIKDMKFDFDRDFKFDFDVDQDVIQKLREKGIKFDADAIRINADDDTPDARLLRAARRCKEAEVRRLITDEKANVNAVFVGDGTALIEAARAGCVPAVRALLNAGADPNLMSPGDGNPLIAAAYRNHEEVARLLIDRGANVNGAAPGDGNPLIAAAQRGHLKMAQMLIDRGANVNGYVEGDETPLMAAAERGSLEIARLLVDRGANVNLAYNVDTWGSRGSRTAVELRSPLNMAERHGNDEIAQYLRSKGAVANPKASN
ncbi:MAG TPA: M56 family metallopeptidase [Hyphomonadaceae bacterium]|nr:M56 family metallopeptidase [Hyphomonadaceae bacterium]